MNLTKTKWTLCKSEDSEQLKMLNKEQGVHSELKIRKLCSENHNSFSWLRNRSSKVTL